MKDLLRASECAKMYGVRPDTVRLWLRKRIIPHVLVGPYAQKRIRRVDAEKYLQSVAGARS